MFTGEVNSDNAERYQYVFQLQRDASMFHVAAWLFDAETKQVLLHEEKIASLIESNAYNWKIGHAFLRFNAINASWVFGAKLDAQHGFNFKVDMLKPAQKTPITQLLRKGVAFIIMQTGPLDGHIVLPNQVGSQFVNSKKTWFRQIWAERASDPTHPLKGVLCQFNDGSGFYSMNIYETDALRGAVAGLFDASGSAMNVSQFINVSHATDGQWHIRIPSPMMHVVLTDSMQDPNLAGGFVQYMQQQGFCLVNEALLNPMPSIPPEPDNMQNKLAFFTQLWNDKEQHA